MNISGSSAPAGTLTLRKFSRVRPAPLAWRLRNFLENRLRDTPRLAIAELAILAGVPTLRSTLSLRVRHKDGTVTDYGVVSTRVVTDAGVAAIVDAFGNTVELENFKFHGFGTGTNAEAVGDTALQTELTTQYAVDSTRPTGSQTENGANVYRTVGTLSPDSGGTIAITEHGIFSASTAGTLMDRSKFSAVNLVAGSDSLQATYDLTFTSGG
jgi:hypothetical protein